VNKRQRRTLAAIFSRPTPANVKWNDLLGLLRGLGATVVEAEGSRVRALFPSTEIVLHRPHPGDELKRYVVHQLREKFKTMGIRP